MSDLHRRAIVFDGLVVSNFNRRVFEDMAAGGITAANCTCCIWEDFEGTALNVARWKRWIAENSDLLVQTSSVADIRRAKENGKVGIVLGWQNSSGYGDNLDCVPFFAELGVRIVQLTYNTANSVGCGCYEGRDGGLTDFGRDLIEAMNRAGVLVDLSHVGPNTSRDAIEASKKPVAYSHCAPAGLKAHPRNKSDEQIRFIADRGGFVGVTMFPAFLARGAASSVEDYVDAIEHVLNLAGEEQVGVGTDMTQEQPPAFFDWITRDKGNGRRLVEFGEALELDGFRRLRDFPNLTAEMERRGWPETRIERVLGGNWLRFLGEVWGA
jgi:membrane dipeptidase